MRKHNMHDDGNVLDTLRRLIGRCGLYCGACDIYRVFVDEKKDKQKRMAAFFKCRPEQVRCQGCQNLTPDDWCSGCKILACLTENGYMYCYECGKIEHCDIYQELNGRYNNHPYKNLERLREVGEKKWLEEQMTRWHCSECGEPLEYSEEICTTCGFNLTKIND
jgi:hypothetical protein